jgi:excisionase family DNA binding protein
MTINGATYWREDVARERFARASETWYTVAEAAKVCGLNQETLYRAMRSGDLEYRLPHGLTKGKRISQSMLDRWLGNDR